MLLSSIIFHQYVLDGWLVLVVPACQRFFLLLKDWLGWRSHLSWFYLALMVADSEECAFPAPNAESVSLYEDVLDVYLVLAAFPARRQRIICVFLVLESGDCTISGGLQGFLLAGFLASRCLLSFLTEWKFQAKIAVTLDQPFSTISLQGLQPALKRRFYLRQN